MFALVLIFLQLMITALLAERSSREKLAIANHQLRLYACQIEEVATLQERTRIARDIHDALGHGLTALHLNLNAALGLWEQDISEAKALLGEAANLSQSALVDVRQAVRTLRAEPRQGKTINEWLQDLSQKLSQTTGIQPECIVNIAHPISDAQKMAAYRIVQEALTNVTKYAQATEVTIRIHTQHNQRDSDLVIAIQDNGKGFERSQNTSGFGLRGMEERAIALGGTLSIDTTPGGGTHIVACLPLLNS